MIVRGVPATVLNKQNKNGRTYATEVFQKALDTCERTGVFEARRLLCSADGHPTKSNFVKPILASHVVIGSNIKRVSL